jgi:hypothetical protein
MAGQPYFSQVWASPSADGGVAVQWRLNPASGLSGSTFSFHVYRGPSGGEWERITTTPVVDDTLFVDRELPLHHELDILDGWYMVSVIDGATERESDPVPITGKLSMSEWRIVREAMRTHSRLSNQFSAIPGWLFRQRGSGERCPCWDSELEDVTDTTCASCYGTGWLGGYHDALAFGMTQVARGEGHGRRTATTSEGSVEDRTLKMLCQAVPQPSSDDVWMHGVTGDKYTIESAAVKEAYRGVPLVLLATLDPVTPGSILDRLQPPDYQSPEWTDGPVDAFASTLTVAMDEDLDVEWSNWSPDGTDEYVDMADVVPLFEVFADAAALDAGGAAILSIGLTATPGGSKWTVASASTLALFVSMDDIQALGAGTKAWRTTFTLDGNEETIERGALIVEAA